jgi:hypothetical protein
LFFPENYHPYHTAIDIARNATGFSKKHRPRAMLRCGQAAKALKPADDGNNITSVPCQRQLQAVESAAWP